MMKQRLRLMIPGPIELDPEVLAVMAEPLVAHYGEEWTAFYKETTRLLQQIFQTAGDIFLFPGSGSAGLDAALGSTLFPDGRVLIPQNGFFGERLEEIARSYTPNVHTLKFPIGRAVDPETVEKTLRDGNFDAVACVHCETSTGVLNPIQELAAMCRSHGIHFIVDAVSSLAVEPLEMDTWGIDICVSASQKGLEAPPGLGVIAVGKRAWDRIN
ncbi:MAG: aminotransferase class V-fold PLP-dependent enzyme, partial [Nitrospiraceae bacterium]|nr:aminotransferase class V-fold PLP-dependent enzyme [Nitrospiraceae bacterium]